MEYDSQRFMVISCLSAQTTDTFARYLIHFQFPHKKAARACSDNSILINLLFLFRCACRRS